MVQKIFCDICNKEIISSETTYNIAVKKNQFISNDNINVRQACSSCATKTIEFMRKIKNGVIR